MIDTNHAIDQIVLSPPISSTHMSANPLTEAIGSVDRIRLRGMRCYDK